MTSKLLVLHWWKKAPSPWEFFFEKKLLPFLCAGKTFKTACRIFLEINGSRDILFFGDVTVPKFAFHKKIIHKTQTTKN